MKKYGKASGAKINMEKSELMYIGDVERVEVGVRGGKIYESIRGIFRG